MNLRRKKKFRSIQYAKDYLNVYEEKFPSAKSWSDILRQRLAEGKYPRKNTL